MDLHGFDLARAPLDVQADALRAIVGADPDLMGLLAVVRDLGLPDGWLVSGALYQTVWNVLTGRPRRTGIKDYDVVYFDGSDLSYEAEDAVIRRVEATARPLGLPVEVRNQARVHLWFPGRFGFEVPPLVSSADSLLRYASTTHAVAARLDAGGRIHLLAPYGLADVFALHMRPNRRLPNGPSHDAKARRCLSVWPELTVEWW
ncbi:nucleotidyltransferase family protein [Chthonobacter rhizosphaerae]|uniref:nucleotidyltransferase family protein n=1 Tax=Chthonobacter rhizosphaerae TaxID=2735553 RepID=UPI0015EFC159|nr:nucleotidyltransferase family protein [Chthonobacter rhizosphaerae]